MSVSELSKNYTVHCPNPFSLQLNASISSQIDEILKEIPNSTNTGMKNIVVLRLPTKHCFFNPIEMVWANIKGYVAKNNHACTIKDTLRLTHEGVNSVSKMLCGVSFKKFLCKSPLIQLNTVILLLDLI